MKNLKTTLMLLCSFLFSNAIFAQWQQTSGPCGGSIWQLTSSGTNLFALAQNNTLYRSMNQGISWVNLGKVTTSTQTINHLNAFGTELYASCFPGLYRSVDSGVTWSNIGLANENVGPVLLDGNNLFASTSSGMFLSSNFGTSWNAINNGLTDSVVGALAINGSYLFAGTQTGVFRSSNNGTNWTNVSSGITGGSYAALTVIGNNIFAGSGLGGGIFLSTNNGNSWTSVNNGLGTSLVVTSNFANIGNTLFVVTSNAVSDNLFMSTNNGTSWSNIGNNTNGFELATIGTSLFTSKKHGVNVTSDNGVSWTDVTNMPNQNITSLVSKGNTIFAGTNTPDVFSSINAGATWSGLNANFASAASGGQSVSDLIVKNNAIFATVNGAGIMKSLDDGVTWTAINNGITTVALLSIIQKDSFLFAGGYGRRIFRSADDGATWVLANNGLPVSTNGYIKSLAVNANNIYATYGDVNGYNDVYLSTDNGNNWASINNGLDTINGGAKAIAIKGNTIFVSLDYGNGIFSTTNNGTSWTAVNTGLTNLFVTSLKVIGNSIFATTNGGGVFFSTNDGASWTSFNVGLLDLSVNELEVSNGILYAGTAGSSVFSVPLYLVPTSVQEAIKSESLKIFPNPSKDIIYIECDDDMLKIGVYDMVGKLVYQEKPMKNKHEIRILNNGIYLIQIETSKKIHSQKIIINN